MGAGGPCWSFPTSAAIPKSAATSSSPGSRAENRRRAVFDALPLLKQAEQVQILEIDEGSPRRNGASTDNSIAVALARHGIKPTVRTSIAGDISVGDEILSRLADMGADLLVMGAYGHSRMRELLFGGVTRHIAKHMTVPTLFSH